MNKQRTTYFAVAAAALVGFLMSGAIFSRSICNLESEVKVLSKKLEDERMFLQQKSVLEAEWQSQKSQIQTGIEADAMLNAWVKDLLSYAQAQSLVLEKLEPAGVKTESGIKKASVFVSFHGDIRSLIRYVYELLDKDVFSRLDSFGMRREEDAQNYSFELILGKIVR